MTGIERASRSTSQPTGIARHGQLKRSHAFSTLFGLIGGAAVVALVSVGSVGAIAANEIKSNISTFKLSATDEHKARTQDISAIKGGANILLIGSDTRVGQTAEQHDADGARNDVTMLVHISEDHSQVTIVSFPRDTMVPIPACTDPDTGKSSYPQTKAMFNTSLAEGGPKGGVACVVKTVENLTGLSIPYAGLITFDGVIAMSNALGGVTVCIAKPIHDGTFLNLPAGQVPLKGDQALAFLRTRHGVGDGSDVARISNQQVFLSAMLRQLTSDGALSNPVTLYKFASAATSNMTLSEGLNNTGTLVSLAAAVRNTNTSDMLLVQYPTEQDPENINRLVVSQDSAHSLNVALQDDARTQIAQGAIGRGAVVSPGASPLPNSGSNNSSPEPKPSSGTTVSNGAASSDNTPVALPSSVTGQSADEQTCSKGTRQ